MAAPAPAAIGNASTFMTLVPEASVLFCMQIAVFGPCLAVTRVWWPSHRDKWSLADTISSVLLYPLLMWHAFWGVIDLGHDVESRWRGTTSASRIFQLLYVTRGILHIGVLFMQRMPRRDLYLMCIHHVLSICAFSSTLLTRNCHYWACLNGCCEVTNIFLNNVWLFKEVTIQGRQLKETLPRVYIANGLCLWVSYILFRLMLFPYWLYTWHADITSVAELTWERVHSFERYFYASVTVFLEVVSMMWFIPITSGLVKAISGQRRRSRTRPSRATP